MTRTEGRRLLDLPDEIVQRLHGLTNRSLFIPPVNLIQVDVVGAQSPERILNCAHDRLPLVIG